jgi:dUTP pyrophosphatase
MIDIAIRRLPHAGDLPLPRAQSAAAAGLDLMACLPAPIRLAPGRRAVVPTGFAIALPDGWEAQVRPRSGLAARHGVTVLNAPGTVDADYRGEIAVVLINHGEAEITIEHGMRIAQLVVAPVARVRWTEVAELPPSERGEAGFGSTGLDAEQGG